MDLSATITDFFRWLGEALAPPPARPPRAALGVVDDAPVLLRWSGAGYAVDRPARSGDKAPLYLNDSQALIEIIQVSPEVAIHGVGGARIEAARRCPFPLSSATSSLTPTGEAWDAAGARWVLAAAPPARLEEMAAKLRDAGAAPGHAFTHSAGVAMPITAPPPRRALSALAVATALVVIGAAAAATLGADRVETAAEARLSAARADLARAEAEAGIAAKAREVAASPLAAAAAADAILAAAADAAGPLAALSAAIPDNAYARRVSVRPGRATADISAPDAAALASALAANPAFSAARLKSAARANTADGLQRATVEITLEPRR